MMGTQKILYLVSGRVFGHTTAGWHIRAPMKNTQLCHYYYLPGARTKNNNNNNNTNNNNNNNKRSTANNDITIFRGMMLTMTRRKI